ncbi:MAG: site-2 protease family protein [Azospirillum sp.]|nr:site-2 protease family protein [Azospirillum sp.]
MEKLLFQASVLVVPVILAITLHEAAHGWVAWKLGDDTALRLGRVSFNPLRHVDPFGTVILPAIMYFSAHFLFGWAKPVPVNFNRLRHPRRDMVWVALAGPATNLILAFLSAWLLRWTPGLDEPVRQWVDANLANSVLINVILAVFNMLPVPPLDGGRVAVGLLPDALARPLARLERVGLMVLIGVIFLLPLLGDQIGVNLNLLPWLLGAPVDAVINAIGTLAGHG